jgi:NhaP-type Na+/H+ or K+/H+ antiporter
MIIIYWYLVIGLLLVGLAITPPLLRAIPISTSIIYLAVGILLGPGFLGLMSWDAIREVHLFERLTEIVVIVSLFTAGLNMRRSLTDTMWLLPVRLAGTTMVLTIAAITAIGTSLLGLPLGAAVLLGAILAPTDPVLASDVQVQGPTDRDNLRYGLTGEAGLNDGTAFPFVMLGLGLLGLHPDDEAGFLGLWAKGEFNLLAWLGWDLLWAVTAGLLVGGLTGWLIGRIVLYLQQHQKHTFALDEFLVLGLIALSYGLAELLYGYGFLAVFAAGYALRYLELHLTNHAPEPVELPPLPVDQEIEHEVITKEPEKAAHFLILSLKNFNEQLERILQATVVLLIGGVLTTEYWAPEVVWLVPLLFLVVRPAAVMLGLIHSKLPLVQRGLIGWFGIRGIGSIYYLTYAIEHGVPDDLARRLTALVLSLVAVSIIVHGITVTPIMSWYTERHERRHHHDARGTVA